MSSKVIVFFLFNLILSEYGYAETHSWRIVTELGPYQKAQKKGVFNLTYDDFVRELIASVDPQAEIEIMPWARAYYIARTQKNVLIFPIAREPEREKDFHWIAELDAVNLSFIGLTERSDISLENIEDAKIWTIGAIRDSLGQQYLEDKNFELRKHFLLRSDLTELLKLLFLGRIDLMVADFDLLYLVIEEKKLSKGMVKVYYQPKDSKSVLYVAANKDSYLRDMNKLAVHLKNR